jgi:malonyl-CoA decarboxylase
MGLMVNYLYDLKRLDKHRSLLAQSKTRVLEIESLCKGERIATPAAPPA